jgi:quercetin dioxygenase-like cupin family protein
MMRTSWIAALALAVGIAAGWIAATGLDAQPTGIKRTLLMKKELAGIEGREVYLGTAEIPPGISAGRHYHAGHEIGFVLEGTAVLEVEGEAPIELRAGDYYHIDASKRHDVRSAGPGPAKAVAIYLIEKGQPLEVAAP